MPTAGIGTSSARKSLCTAGLSLENMTLLELLDRPDASQGIYLKDGNGRLDKYTGTWRGLSRGIRSRQRSPNRRSIKCRKIPQFFKIGY